ncbi:MAG: DUF5666 domain-containing protein [Anaerolineae bacterium]|nr:DUF5666 domain-containing protein [Anaerolineae bacterium]
MSRTLRVVLGVIVVLILVGGSFYGGTLYGKQQALAQLPEAFRQRLAQFGQQRAQAGTGTPQAQPGQGGFARFGGQGGGLIGQIEEINGDTLIITNFEGQQTRVQVTETTLIEKYASVTVAELEPGEQVIVSGSENEDGSITARSVQVAPAGRFAPGGPPPASGSGQ